MVTEETKKEGGNKKYDDTIAKLKLILNNDSISLPTKVKSTDLSAIVSDLFKEEAESNRALLKEELKTLLKKHVVLLSELEKKRKECNELEKQKQGEFVTAAKVLFDKIEGIDTLGEDYTKSLENALENVIKTK
jgi:hypothetical protein